MDQKPNNPDQDLQEASRATAEDDYAEYISHGSSYSAPRHRLRKVLIVLGIIAAVALIGFALYWFVVRDDAKQTDDKQTARTPAASQAESEDSGITAETEHHISQTFMLEFDYPKDWEVVETTGSGKLTATSPAVQLKDAAGNRMTGQIVFMVRNKQQPLPEFDKGNAVAARESEKVAYTKPSSVQRGSTYLSFLRYAATNASSGLDGIFITGDVGYQAGQAIPKADFTPVDPIISVTFLKCADSTCSGEAVPSAIDVSVWKDAAFAQPVKKMLQSLIVS